MKQYPVTRSADLTAMVDQWLKAGVITPEQAARMQADVGLPGKKGSLAIEALGYLGSVLIVVASLLLTSAYWDRLSTAGQMAIPGTAAVVLLLAGFAVPARLGAAGLRMHAVLWFGATVSTAGFLGLLGNKVLGLHAEDLALLVFAGTTVVAAALWWRLPASLLQHAAVFVGLAGAAGALAAQFHVTQFELPGFAVWAVGATWFVLGLMHVVRPRWLALVVGGVGLMVGPGMTMPSDAGIVLGLITITALVVLAVLARDLLVLALGAWGALQFLPIAVNEWFPGELSAAIALLTTGAVLVAVAIWIARRRRERADPR